MCMLCCAVHVQSGAISTEPPCKYVAAFAGSTAIIHLYSSSPKSAKAFALSIQGFHTTASAKPVVLSTILRLSAPASAIVNCDPAMQSKTVRRTGA